MGVIQITRCHSYTQVYDLVHRTKIHILCHVMLRERTVNAVGECASFDSGAICQGIDNSRGQ